MKKLFCFTCFMTIACIYGQEAVLLKDIATSGESTFRYDYEIESFNVGKQMYFIVEQEKYGRELWRTNGTEVGTQLVKDIYPGGSSSSPKFVEAFDNKLFFTASEPGIGRRLFTTTGSEHGTKPLTDNEGNFLFSISQAVFLNEAMYYFSGNVLYRTGGTSETTLPVFNLTDFGINLPNLLAVGNGLIYFSAYTLELGYELYITDGNPSNIKLLKDINPGTENSNPQSIYPGENKVYFVATDSAHGKELWVTDATEQGTVMVADLTPGTEDSNITILEEINQTLYFVYKREVWKTDGTEANTKKIAGDIRYGGHEMFKGNLYFKGDNRLWRANGVQETLLVDVFVYGSFACTETWLYFTENNGSDGTVLWRTDGTDDGAEIVEHIYTDGVYDIENLYAADEQIYFTADTDSFGIELWSSDGTEEGTFMLIDSKPGPEDGFKSYRDLKFGAIGSELIFTGYSPENGRELWISDGTKAGTRELRDLTPRTEDVSLSGTPVPLNEQNFFLAETGLWKTDGTPEGTTLIKDFGNTSLGTLKVLNNSLIFSAHHPHLNHTLWISDGTTEGTNPIFDTTNNPAKRLRMITDNPILNGEIYFKGTNDLGNELWKTDGTANGTVMVKDIAEGEESSGLLFLTEYYTIFQNNLYFIAGDETLGMELWKTDGTAEGTVPVTDINPQGDSYPMYMTVLGNKIIFRADDGSIGRELWITDGTAEGTTLLKDIYPGEEDGVRSEQFINYKGYIYFQGRQEDSGIELWRTDGTPEGTQLFLDIRTGESWSGPSDFQVIEDTLYFNAFTNNNNGRRLFKTDGTVQGTDTVSSPEIWNAILGVNQDIIVTGKTDSTGIELWRLPATKVEPILMTDIMPGADHSYITYLSYSNNKLFFRAFDDQHGHELWSLSPLQSGISVQMKNEYICSAEDTLRFHANIQNAGENPVIKWLINNQPVPGASSTEIELTGIQQGDEIKAAVKTETDLWLTAYHFESEIYTVSYQQPVAEISVNQANLSASEGASYIWYLDGNPLPNTTQNITADVSGTYSVEVFNEYGCSALSNPLTLVLDPTGTKVIPAVTEIHVFPNPAADYIYMQSSAHLDLELKIISLNGKMLYHNQLRLLAGEATEIPVAFLEKGIYFLQGISDGKVYRQTITIY